MEIRGDAMQLWQVTEASCALSYTGRRYELPPNEDGVGFLLDMGVELTIRAGGSPNQRKMRTEGAITDWGLERVASLPSSCNAVIPADPVSVFDSLWATYSENYPFNADKGVDWDKARAEYRPQVHADTSPAQLFDILSSMIRPLHDMHTHLFATDIGLGYDGWRPDTSLTPRLCSIDSTKSSRSATWAVRSELGRAAASRSPICPATWAISEFPPSISTRRTHEATPSSWIARSTRLSRPSASPASAGSSSTCA
jgi:hypothetical protein